MPSDDRRADGGRAEATPAAGHRLAATLARRDVQAVTALIVAQAILVAGYFAATSARPTSLRYVWYPVVWITVGVWAAASRSTPSADRRRRVLAAAVAAGYLLVLARLGNVVAPASHGAGGVRVIAASPGWGPTLQYSGAALTVTAIPFVVIGYAALSYLVYAAVLDASGAALSGLVGLAACASCSLPLVAALIAGIAGTGAANAAYALSLDVATLAYLLSAAGLYWGPAIGGAIGGRPS
ncbi:DUF7546 family protein [Natronoarchaeum mannanilyticum]|uniref:ABC transporter ATP-binding protein n=1 Tax=Natronoarchaeum mannanilyticum TaxID=926360 RepID=A0AAV3T7B5_9EURY